MNNISTYIVDAFTNQPFGGNPAGVCIVESNLSAELMLKIAQELNLSETAFVQRSESEHQFSIRYFSPKMEIPLCGHATLASARVLYSVYKSQNVEFSTVHNVKLNVASSESSISMTFPVYETTPSFASQEMLKALGIEKVNNCVYNKELNILQIEIDSVDVLRNLTPNYEELVKTNDNINGVLVTSQSFLDDYDFHSRYFWPWSGSNEDPVTGGTHTFLAKYWADKLGKKQLKSFQSSKRSGFMNLDVSVDKVQITSQAIVVLTGNLSI
jgi:PhzF family phenazine biosynthesis protein